MAERFKAVDCKSIEVISSQVQSLLSPRTILTKVLYKIGI